MNTHTAEVVTESALHVIARGVGQRLAATLKGTKVSLQFGTRLRIRRLFLDQDSLARCHVFAGRAGSLDDRPTNLAATACRVRRRQAHHMVGDAVRFILKWIVGVSDNELCLERAADWRCSGRYL